MDPDAIEAVEQLAGVGEQVVSQLEGLGEVLQPVLPPEVRPVAGWLLWLLKLFARHAYVLALVGAFLENTIFTGILLPGGSVVVMAGAGARTGGLFLPAVMVLGAAGMLLGALVNYAVGRMGASRFLRRGRLACRYRRQLAQARLLLRRHGWWAMTLSYVFGPGRSALAVAAGVARLPLAQFVAYQAPAALLWGAAFAGGGYALAREWQTVQVMLRRAGWAGLAVFTAVVAAWWVVRTVASHRRATASSAARGQ